MDDNIASFIGITGASTKNAESYLRVADGDLAQAVQLFFDMGGAEMDIPASSNAPVASTPTQPSGPPRNAPIVVDDDADMEMDEDDDDFRVALEASRSTRPTQDNSASITAGSTRLGEQWDDDEAIARRLQEQFYSDIGPQETNGVRAPIARTTETLLGPDEDFLEQITGARGGGRRGGSELPPLHFIFCKQYSDSNLLRFSSWYFQSDYAIRWCLGQWTRIPSPPGRSHEWCFRAARQTSKLSRDVPSTI